LDCALIDDSNQTKFKFKVVSNSGDSFIVLIDWLSKHIKLTVPEYHFVMEATGVYHERCAEWLFNTGLKVSVVNPAHIKYYVQSLGVRSKNDKKDSVVLARYGLTQKPVSRLIIAAALAYIWMVYLGKLALNKGGGTKLSIVQIDVI